MALNLQEAAEMLGVSSDTVRRWARQGLLGARQPSGELRFDPVELRRWAERHGLRPCAPAAKPAGQAEVAETRPLAAALARGGILRDVEGQQPAEVLEALLRRLPPAAEGLDRAELLDELLQRESLSSTGLGHGVALPHPRRPSPRLCREPCVWLALLAQPVDWKALDGQPVHSVFLLLSPDAQRHLRVLSRVAFLLRDASFCGLLARRAADEEILGEIAKREPAQG